MKKFDKFVSLIAVCIVIFGLFAFFGVSPQAFARAKTESLTTAKSMAVVEKSSGRLLYFKNENEQLPMASTTKIITAIYVIEHTDDLDKSVEIKKSAVGIEGTSIGLKEGEHLTIRELLYGLMLRSGNDCAVALAIETSGSVEKFCEDVNKFLNEHGFEHTRLANPHGLPAKDHYTTASDLALITAYALKNPIFSEIVSTKDYQVSNELNSSFSRKLKNKNKMLSSFEYADGVKTGYTRAAGRCFVGSATKDGMQVICVLLNCVPMFEECEALLNKAFDEYSLYKLISKGDKLGDVGVVNSKTKNIEVFVPEDFYYPLKQSEKKDVRLSIALSDQLTAPVMVNTLLGKIEISLENQLIFSEKIFTIKEIDANDFGSNLNKIFEKMNSGKNTNK